MAVLNGSVVRRRYMFKINHLTRMWVREGFFRETRRTGKKLTMSGDDVATAIRSAQLVSV